MSKRELPYDFDLLYDIKMMYQVEAIAKGEPTCSDASPEDLVELFENLNLEMPDCLKPFQQKGQQSALESKIEVACNYATGILLAYLIYRFIVLPFEWLQNQSLMVVMIFTLASVVRSYYWRRFFNAELHKAVHAAVTKLWRKP